MTISPFMLVALLILAATVGAFVEMLWLYFQLATGRRTVRPWPFKTDAQ